MTGDGGLVEVQATAERTPLSRAHLDELLALAAGGIEELRALQAQAVGRAMRLVLATRNAHKAREFAALLAPHELVPLPDDVELPPETGETFEENALVKARAAAAATGLPRRRRRLRHRGGRARRPAGRALGALTPARRDRRGEPGQAPARGARRQRARVRLRARLRRAGRRRARRRRALHRHARRRAARRRAASATTRRSCPTTCPTGARWPSWRRRRRTRSATAAAPRASCSAVLSAG